MCVGSSTLFRCQSKTNLKDENYRLKFLSHLLLNILTTEVACNFYSDKNMIIKLFITKDSNYNTIIFQYKLKCGRASS